jgi:hypothetical protein
MLFIFLFSLFLTNFPDITFNNQITVNNNFLYGENFFVNNLFLDGIISINTTSSSNFNNSGAVIFINLPKKTTTKILALDNSNNLCYQERNSLQIRSTTQDSYDTIYTNGIFPFSLGETILNINTATTNETHIGNMEITNTSKTVFNTKKIYLNAATIASGPLDTFINLSSDLTATASIETELITIDNNNKENKIIAKDIIANKIDTNNDIIISSPTVTINRLGSLGDIEISSNNTSLSLHNFGIRPLNDLTMNIYPIFLDDNNIISRATQPYNITADTITIKNLWAVNNNENFPTPTNLTIEAKNITNFNTKVGQRSFGVDTLGNTTIHNTDSNKFTIIPSRNVTTISGEIVIGQLDTADFTRSSSLHDQYSGLIQGTATITNTFMLNNTLNLPQKTIFNNIPIFDQIASLQKVIVTDEAQGWAWGFMPVQTSDNVEEEEPFILAKEDFLKSIIPIIAETENNQEFATFSLPELESSELCSLIIEYDENKQPLSYDEQGILAIALTQLPQIKKELSTLESLQEEGNKEIEVTHEEVRESLIKANECIFDFINEIKKIASNETTLST